jgi:hypothetical protein
VIWLLSCAPSPAGEWLGTCNEETRLYLVLPGPNEGSCTKEGNCTAASEVEGWLWWLARPNDVFEFDCDSYKGHI